MDWPQILGVLGLGALTGTVITQLMTNARDRRSQRVAYLKQQLEQFYGPLLAAHKEIRARSELRVKVQNAIDTHHARAAADRGASACKKAASGARGHQGKQVPARWRRAQTESRA